ncbi:MULTISPECIES: AMP-binding protein [unclassified Sphingomonas]|nr:MULTISPECIES: AMP-binding protein [unclassified Sphingomonas]
MSGLARHGADRFGDRIAVSVLGSGEEISFREIDDLAGRYAGGLAALGIGRGDRVIIHLANGIGWIVAYHALARLGAIVVPANILLSPAEVAFIATDSEASLIILGAERKVDISQALVDLVGRDLAAIVHADSSRAGMPPAMLGHDYRAPVSVEPEDVFTIGYTSGTTGRPKGATQTHEAVFLSTAMTATVHVRSAEDRVLTALPFPHVYGNVVMNAAFLAGLRLYVLPRFEAGAALAAIEGQGITLFEGVPTMYYQMLSHPAFSATDFGALSRCTVGGQTIPVSVIEEVSAKMGCPVLELWGMTEVAGPATTHSPYWPSRPGTIGLPFPGFEVRIADLDDAERTVAAGEAGELCVRGPLVTRGYWRNADATQAAIDADGWLATGDVAVREPDGYLRIVDRRKDLIITAGYNVYPAELEQVIAMHPAIAMVAVAAIPDREKGELAKAFVVLRPGMACDADELAAHCRRHLAAYKQPRAFAFVDELPRTSTGKILRRALRPEPAITEPL